MSSLGSMATTAAIPDQDALRRIGASVRERLARDDQAYKIPTDKAEIFAIGGFFSPAECARLIGMIDAVARPSELFDSPMKDAFRTSYSGNFDPSDPFVKSISRRIDDRLGIRSELGETIQGQRYAPGQEFKDHYDYFHTSEPYWKDERRHGGQRSWTAMAYLNEVAEGGATGFPEVGISVPPTQGVLLVWNNATPDGVPNEGTLHSGTPVVAGQKYVLTRWYRVRPWKPSRRGG